MKNKNTQTAVGAFIVVSIFAFVLIASKYNNLKKAYVESERKKVEYCKTVKELCKDTAASNILQEDYYELWEENQRFSSIFAEIENEPGGHEILEKLWSNYDNQ